MFISFDKNHGVTESLIDFKSVALTTQAHQPLLEKTMFNFINDVKVKWSISLILCGD